MADVPSTNVNPMDTFQQDVIKKLRESIRDMLPDEVLKEMVHKAVTKEFFEPTKIKNPNYNGYERNGPEYTVGPSWFTKEVVEQSKPMIKTLVLEYVEQQKPNLEAAITAFTKDNSLMLLALSALQLQSYSAMGEFARQTSGMIVEELRNKGALRY